MTRTPVTSSMLKSIGHDPATNTLEVEYHDGKIYQHAGVTAAHHAALLAAPSIGAHFNTRIKGKFAHTRLDKEKP
jgi:hypothetical protein